MSCESCKDDPITAVYYFGSALGTNIERQSALYRCAKCGALYEVFPAEKAQPQEIAEDLARRLFPDASLRGNR